MSMPMSYTRQPNNSQEPRWGVRLETESSRVRNPRPDRLRGLRVFVMSTFLLHLMVYAVVIGMLFLVNLFTWEGLLWAVFPAIGWGALVTIHGGVAFLTASAGVSRSMVNRAQAQTIAPAPKRDSPEGELHALIEDGLAKVDEMRTIGRRIRATSARRNALEAVNSMENTLIVLEGQLDELPLAREFSGSFLEPAWHIFVEYDRLSQRQIESASELLRTVERVDFPRIADRADQLHERMHRGTMIDLQVAREMLDLGTGA